MTGRTPPRLAATPKRRLPASALTISQTSADYLDRGHCYITKDRDTGDTSRFNPGDLVDLYDPQARLKGRAVVDPGAKIVARAIRSSRKIKEISDFSQQARSCLAYRKQCNIPATFFRLVHGEADGIPGVFIDQYDRWLVGQITTSAVESIAEEVLRTLAEATDAAGALLKLLPKDRRQAETFSGRWVLGSAGPESLIVSEYDTKYQVFPFSGLPTGIYLDHRENRRKTANLSSGLKVLNTFAYTGAFSVACGKQGAQRVDSVDLSSKALEQARENVALNGLSLDAHRFFATDVFAFLSDIRDRYDMIILDPPTHSTSHHSRWSPDKVNGLHEVAVSALVSGGFLVSASNFSGFTSTSLQDVLHKVCRKAQRDCQIVSELYPGPDFPWLAGFPESRSVRGVIARIL